MNHTNLAVAGIVAGLVLAPAAAAAQAELTVYGNWPREWLEVLEQEFERLHPEVDMTFFRAPAEELNTIFLTEMRQGVQRADYIFAHTENMDVYRAEGHLRSYVPEGVASMVPAMTDPDGYWVPLTFGPNMIVYNTAFVDEADAPTSFADLLDPFWRDRIGITDPRTASGVHGPLQFWTEVLAEERGEPPYGWSFVEALAEQTPVLVSGHQQLMDLVVTGELWAAVSMTMIIASGPYLDGEPVALVWPEEGVPSSITAGAIAEGGPNPESAELFQDYLASAEGQQFLADNFGTASAHLDVTFTTPDGRSIDEINTVQTLVDPASREENAARFAEIMER